MMFLACMAHPLVEVLLSAKWLGCVPYLQMLCLVGALVPLRKASTTVLKATNNVNAAIRLQLMSRLTSLLVLAMIYRFGVRAMIFGEACSLAAFTLLYLRQVASETGVSVSAQIRAACSCVIPAGIAAVFILGLQQCIDTNPYAEVIAFSTGGAFIYLTICYWVGNEALTQTVAFAQDLLSRMRRQPGNQAF
jgi:O-antigen/teichoic acid export membrane protein